MTIGDKIKQARKMRGLTQQQLGSMINLPAFRIGQYESDIRTPKEAQLKEIAIALDVPIEFFKNRHIDTYTDVLYALLELEKTFDLNVFKLDNTSDKYALSFDDISINTYLKNWLNEKKKSVESSSSKAEYEEWKITFSKNIE